MANLGLLQGLGRGLSQGADILSRGMAEDREVERQRMREASIEKRWKRQEEKDDARYADSKAFQEQQMKRQELQDAKADSRYADQLKAQDEDRAAQDKYRSDQLSLEKEKLGITTSERRRAEIEGTFEAVERKYQRELTKLDREYERKLDVARASGGDTEAIYKEYNTRAEALGKQELNDYLPLVKSYGSELKGTAVASYLELLDQKPANTETADPQTIQNALGDLTGGQESTGRSDFMSSARIGAAAATPKTIAPSNENVQPGFVGGLASGGIAPKVSVDLTDASPLEVGLTKAGQAIASATPESQLKFGLLQRYNQAVVQPAYDWLTTKPSQKK